MSALWLGDQVPPAVGVAQAKEVEHPHPAPLRVARGLAPVERVVVVGESPLEVAAPVGKRPRGEEALPHVVELLDGEASASRDRLHGLDRTRVRARVDAVQLVRLQLIGELLGRRRPSSESGRMFSS